MDDQTPGAAVAACRDGAGKKALAAVSPGREAVDLWRARGPVRADGLHCIHSRNLGTMARCHHNRGPLTGTLRINPADTEYAANYINGDTTLDDPHKKILLTEQAFQGLMFDVKEP